MHKQHKIHAKTAQTVAACLMSIVLSACGVESSNPSNATANMGILDGTLESAKHKVHKVTLSHPNEIEESSVLLINAAYDMPSSDVAEEISIEGVVLVPSSESSLAKATSFHFKPLPNSVSKFEGSILVDWLGPATIEIRIASGQDVIYRETITVASRPSRESMREIQALMKAIKKYPDGRFMPLAESWTGEHGLALSPDGINRVNAAIDVLNRSNIGQPIEKVISPLYEAAKGYWWCIGVWSKCSIYSDACIAAAPAAYYACTAACSVTTTKECMYCITVAAGGIASMCEAAYNCWVDWWNNC